MAIRAARVPVHPPVFPEPPLVRPARFAFVYVKPVAVFRIIRRIDDLQAPAWKRGQILDQRLDADDGHRAVERWLALRTRLPDNKPAPLFRDFCREQTLAKYARGIERRAVLQGVHQAVRMGVLRMAPVIKFLRMAALAAAGLIGWEARARGKLSGENAGNRNLPRRRA
jgi:hypothetical protein